MSEVKPVPRFTCGNNGFAFCQGCYEMSEDEDGHYVEFSAYEALQKENAELKEINESLHSSSKFTYENQKRDLQELKTENAAQAKQIAEFERILEGVPEGAFEGGWTARGIMKHAADLVRENKSLRKQLETAVSRINDMLESDDGQAHKEARKFIESLPAPENGE